MAANDALAQGARSVTFPSNSHIAQDVWDRAFGPRDVQHPKKTKKKVSRKTATNSTHR